MFVAILLGLLVYYLAVVVAYALSTAAFALKVVSLLTDAGYRGLAWVLHRVSRWGES